MAGGYHRLTFQSICRSASWAATTIYAAAMVLADNAMGSTREFLIMGSRPCEIMSSDRVVEDTPEYERSIGLWHSVECETIFTTLTAPCYSESSLPLDTAALVSFPDQTGPRSDLRLRGFQGFLPSPPYIIRLSPHTAPPVVSWHLYLTSQEVPLFHFQATPPHTLISHCSTVRHANSMSYRLQLPTSMQETLSSSKIPLLLPPRPFG